MLSNFCPRQNVPTTNLLVALPFWDYLWICCWQKYFLYSHGICPNTLEHQKKEDTKEDAFITLHPEFRVCMRPSEPFFLAFWLTWTNVLWVKPRILYRGKSSLPPNDQILKESSVSKWSIQSGYFSANKLNMLGTILLAVGQLAQDDLCPWCLILSTCKTKRFCVNCLEEGLAHTDFCTIPRECCLTWAKSMPWTALTSEQYQEPNSCTRELNSKLLEHEHKCSLKVQLGSTLFVKLAWSLIWETLIKSKCKKWAKASEFSKILCSLG